MNTESRRGPQGRGIIERDILDKIWAGDIATLHLPARDVYVFNQLAIGETYEHFVSSDIDMHPRSMIRSLQYLRDAFEVGTTDQAFGMLVARGFPLPDALMPVYEKDPKFTQMQLEELKQWVEGKSHTAIADEKGQWRSAVTMNFYRARVMINAVSNTQLVAVALKEGFLRSQRQEDGTYIFTVDENPRTSITETFPQSAVIFPSPQQ